MLANKGVCDCCGKEVDQEIFLPGMCDVHTHGMKKHGLVELQMVLEYPKEMIAIPCANPGLACSPGE